MPKEKATIDTCPICRQPIDVLVRMAEPFLHGFEKQESKVSIKAVVAFWKKYR